MSIKGKQLSDDTITQINTNILTNNIINNTDVTNKEFVLNNINSSVGGFYQSQLNTNMVANVATVGQKACDIAIIEFPISEVLVSINGGMSKVGLGLHCYFSPDGIIIRSGNTAQKGDYLYWNLSNYDLDTNDRISFNYLVAYNYLTLNSGSTVTLNPIYNSLVIKYISDSGTSMTVVVDGINVRVGNVNGNFVWDIGGSNEYIFYSANTYTVVTYAKSYTIWFDGFGSLISSIKYNNVIDDITIQYISGMTTPPDTYFTQVIDALVKRIKPIIQNKADVIYLGNINDSNDSFRNLVKDAHHGTRKGSGLVWDSYYGYSNPSGTGYIDTHYNPSTQGVRFTLNDAGYSVYVFNNTTEYVANEYYYGSRAGSNYAVGGKTSINSFGGCINSPNIYHMTNIPFMGGIFTMRRTASNAMTTINQNLANVTSAIATTSIPSVNVYLFGYNLSNTLISPYIGGLNFFYAGASLTDVEYNQLNNAYNDYLIQCLFLKYGLSNWGVQMAQSYFLSLHNFEKYEAWEVYEFIKRHQNDYVDSAGTGYYYNTFGPSGQNKTIVDYIIMLKAGGNLLQNVWTKSGATLRWNQSTTITSSNTMPAYTRGTMLGIITVTSTDGWNGVTNFAITQTNANVNSYYGNFPLIEKLKTSGSKTGINGNNNRCKYDFRGFINYASLVNANRMDGISFPGYGRYLLSNMVGGSYTGVVYLIGSGGNAQSLISGDITSFTTEISETSASFILFAAKGITGSLENIVFNNATQTLNFTGCGMTKGFRHWRTSIISCTLTNNEFTTSEVNDFLAFLNTFYATNTPTANLTLDLSGVTMGIPTGGASNTDLLGIVTKFSVAGKTATITVRTS